MHGRGSQFAQSDFRGPRLKRWGLRCGWIGSHPVSRILSGAALWPPQSLLALTFPHRQNFSDSDTRACSLFYSIEDINGALVGHMGANSIAHHYFGISKRSEDGTKEPHRSLRLCALEGHGTLKVFKYLRTRTSAS